MKCGACSCACACACACALPTLFTGEHGVHHSALVILADLKFTLDLFLYLDSRDWFSVVVCCFCCPSPSHSFIEKETKRFVFSQLFTQLLTQNFNQNFNRFYSYSGQNFGKILINFTQNLTQALEPK